MQRNWATEPLCALNILQLMTQRAHAWRTAATSVSVRQR
jgi:hypothetical protein